MNAHTDPRPMVDLSPLTGWSRTERVGEIHAHDGTRMRTYGVIVTAKLTREEGTAVTTEHAIVAAPLRLSITGEVVSGRGRRDADYLTAGQCVDSIGQIDKLSPGWTVGEASELAAIWSRWHLNDMRAGCAHHDRATLIREPDRYSPGGTRIATGAVNACPVTGYGWGTSWLTEMLPAELPARIAWLMRDRSNDLYAARGYDASGKAFPTR